MSIGLITSPSTWLNGTVASPTWFQNVQDNINGWISGSGSAIVMASTISSTTAPTTTITVGGLYKDSVVFAWGRVLANGTLVQGMNIASIVNNSTGQYTITWQTPSSHANYAFIPTAVNNTSPAVVQSGAVSAGSVLVFSTVGGSAANQPFAFMVIGGY